MRIIRRSAEIRFDSEIKNRLRSGRIGASRIAFVYLYPNQQDLVNQIDDSGRWWYHYCICKIAKIRICKWYNDFAFLRI